MSGQAMRIKQVAIDDVKPYPGNPRRDHSVGRVAASIQEYGWRQPIVVGPDGYVVAGHGRLLAARELGLAKVPVHYADDLTEDQARAYRIADNRSAEGSEWDDAALLAEMEMLDEAQQRAAGFEADEMDELRRRLEVAEAQPPDGFPEVDEDIDVAHVCPRCGYAWSGGKTVPLSEVIDDRG